MRAYFELFGQQGVVVLAALVYFVVELCGRDGDKSLAHELLVHDLTSHLIRVDVDLVVVVFWNLLLIIDGSRRQ